MRLAVLVSSVAGVAATHTTAHLVAAALARGHAVRLVEPWDLDLDERGRVQLRAFVLDGMGLDRLGLVEVLRTRSAPRRTVAANDHDALLLRVNPIDTTVVAFAQLAQRAGLRVLNDPDTLLATTHKSWLASLPEEVPRPRTLVTRSLAVAGQFARTERGGVVVKPARASGGKGVGWVQGAADELQPAFEAASRAGDGWVVVQAYLPEATDGEKRLLWLDGELVGGYRRVRAPGDFRHNLRRGGLPEATEVDDADRMVVAALAPHLRRCGVWFAGLDLIGGKAVEVNVLNPGGAHFTTLLGGVSVGERLVAALEGLGPRVAPDYQRRSEMLA
jgi:glutathione synthase